VNKAHKNKEVDKLDPKAKELIKEFEKELACMWWYAIRVCGPVLKIEGEWENIFLVKYNNKIFLEYDSGFKYAIGAYTPNEIRKILEWDKRLEWIRKEMAKEPPLSEQQKDMIRKKLRAGEDIHKVSQEVGACTLAVYEFAKKENLPINLPIEYTDKYLIEQR